METNNKIYSVALASIAIVFFIITASSTAVASGEPAGEGSPITAITDGNRNSSGNMHVYYFDNSAHVRELAWFKGKWYARDVTADAGGQNAGEGSPITAITDGSGNMHVYYFDNSAHVRELAWFNGKWYPRDVTKDAV